MQSLRKVRDYATGDSQDLQEQMGTDFDSIREPLAQLNELRQMTPKAMVTKHLFNGDSSTLDSMESSVRDSLSISGPAPANPHPAPPGGQSPAAPAGGTAPSGAAPSGPPGGVTQVDPSRLNGDTAAPAPAAKPRRLDVTDWDAT